MSSGIKAAIKFWPVWALAATPAFAQVENLPTNTAIPSLMFFTLFAGLAVAVGLFVYFLRRRSNREAAKRVLSD